MTRSLVAWRGARGKTGGGGERRGNLPRGSGHRIPPLAGVATLACVVLAALTMAEGLVSAGVIRHGVSVGDVALGGKTPAEARVALQARYPDGSGRLSLSGPTGTIGIPEEKLGARLDVRATVEKAYAVGRRGSLLERLIGRVESPFGTSVPAELHLRPGAAREAVEEISGRMNREARDAAVDVNGSTVLVSGAETGYRLDVPATAREIEQALAELSPEARASGRVIQPRLTTEEAEAAAREARRAVSGPLVLTAPDESWKLSPAEVGSALIVARKGGTLEVGLDLDRLRRQLSGMYADLTVKPVEAGYEVKGGADPTVSVTPGREGRKIEEDELFHSILKGIFEGKRRYSVTTVAEKPDLTTARAVRLAPTDLLGSYRTNYAIVRDASTRVENLAISSGAVNGTFLAPGEVFSMNSEVSHLDYEQTKVIVGGQETTADGGGLCQVTSTLYNAANFAGLDVIERTPHSSQLPYIRPGMDATVWWGGPGKADDLDMKFRNTTDGYVLLRERVARDGYVYAEIWGRPTGTEVTMNSKPAYMGRDGSEWVTRQKIEKDGKVIFDGVLHRDSYEPLVDEYGNSIPTPDVPVAPVDP